MPKAVRKSGTEYPEVPKFYSNPFCPFANTVDLGLKFMDIDYEYIKVDFGNKTPEFLKVNPLGKVPAIDDNGRSIHESIIILEFLAEEWESPSGKRLMPTDPAARAEVRIHLGHLKNSLIQPLIRNRRATSIDQRDKATDDILEGFKIFDEILRNIKACPFAHGEDPGIIDFVVARFSWRQNLLPKFYKPVPEECDYFHRWSKAIEEHPTFLATTADIDVEMIIRNAVSWKSKFLPNDVS